MSAISILPGDIWYLDALMLAEVAVLWSPLLIHCQKGRMRLGVAFLSLRHDHGRRVLQTPCEGRLECHYECQKYSCCHKRYRPAEFRPSVRRFMASTYLKSLSESLRQLLEYIEVLRLLESDFVLEVLNVCLMKEFGYHIRVHLGLGVMAA